jgi:hypothetical protein
MTAVSFCDELDFALGWIHPAPAYQRRASHALGVEGRVWLFDPVEGDGVDERVRALGEPAGVIQQFGRHTRDGRAFAERYGVPLHVLSVGDAPFEEIRLSKTEIAVWSPTQRTLVVAEAVGTGVFDRTVGERLGVHPMMRLAPPRALLALSPEHLLVGHGAGLHGRDATKELHRAISQSARRAPLLALNLVPALRPR